MEINYDWLEQLTSKNISKVLGKIDVFYQRTGNFPENVDSLDSECAVTECDFITLMSRGKLERKLNKINDLRIVLLRIHNKKDDLCLSDDNQLVTYDGRRRFKLEGIEDVFDEELGLSCFSKDVDSLKEISCLRSFSTNGRIFYIRPRRKICSKIIVPECGGKSLGTLISPLYHIEDVLDNKEEVLDNLNKQGLSRRNLQIVENLFSENVSLILKGIEMNRISPHYDLGNIRNFVIDYS